MPFFAYKARNTQGELVKGVLESADSDAVAEQLFNTGITPLEITETRKPLAGGEDNWWARFTEVKIRPIDVQLFSRQLYTLLKAGVPIMRSLAGLQESAISKPFGRVLGDMREALNSGRELSAAMHMHPQVFSLFYLSMVRVGEMTGRLDEVFLRLFGHLEFERSMSERVKTALRYPLFVIVTMAVAVVVINIFVIPAFAKVYAGFNAELPLMTRILLGTSQFMVKYWALMLMLLVSAVFGFRAYVATVAGRYRWDKVKLRLPIVGKIVLKGSLARFARSFALASKSGVPILQALNVVAQTVDNAYIASRVTLMRDGIERGESILRTATISGVFTPVVLQMVAVGEETGELDTLMDEVGEMYEREVDYELKT
ncbi:MAG: type II secretion system F family protein, partial [Arenimonas sp.]